MNRRGGLSCTEIGALGILGKPRTMLGRVRDAKGVTQRPRRRNRRDPPQFTPCGNARPAKCASILSSASLPISIRASIADVPMCGSRNALSRPR